MEPNTERDIGRLEGKLDLVIKQLSDLTSKFTDRDESINKRFADVHARISRIQGKVLFWSGVCGAVTFIIANFGNIIAIAHAAI